MSDPLSYPFDETLPEPAKIMEVASGVFWLRMPLPFDLDHINLYLIRGETGWTLVDCGINAEICKELWEQIIETYFDGLPLERIIVTHFHPDHVGLAGWLVKKTGAEFCMSRAEWLSARAAYLDDQNASREYMINFYKRSGLAPSSIEDVYKLGNMYHSNVTEVPVEYNRIKAGDHFMINGNRWDITTAAGHSPEHVCLHCEELDVVIGGDFLLPRISPIISIWFTEPDGNPLAEFFDFLSGADDLNKDPMVLPAHGRPYRGMATRMTQLRDHHHERLIEALEVCKSPALASDVMKVMFSHRTLDPVTERFAIGETLAHLNLLIAEGKLERQMGDDGRYQYIAA